MEIAVAVIVIESILLLGLFCAWSYDVATARDSNEYYCGRIDAFRTELKQLKDKLNEVEYFRSELKATLNAEFIACGEVIKERDKLKEDLVNAEARYGQMKLLRDSELRTCHSVSTERDSLRLSLAGANQEIKKLHEMRGSLQREYNELHGKYTQLQEKLSRVESALKPPVSVNDAGKPVYWSNRQDVRDATFKTLFGRAYVNT